MFITILTIYSCKLFSHKGPLWSVHTDRHRHQYRQNGFATHLHLCLCWCRPLWTVLYIIIEPIFISVCVCVGQCEHTITRPRENSDDTCVDICVLDKLFHPCLLLSIQGVCIRYWQLFVLVWWRVTQVQGELWRQRMDGILGLVRCHEQSYWCKLQTLLNENSIIIVRNEVAKVMFLHVSVSHSVHRGGVCYPSMHCRWYPSMPCSRWGAIPACIAGDIPACLAVGECAIPACIAGGIPACLAAGGSAPGGVCSWGHACSRGVPAPGGCGDPPRKQMAPVADGTHHTGKHSCFKWKSLKYYRVIT